MRRDRPGCWFGYLRHFVCKPSEDVVEDAQFRCIADGFVFFDETHTDFLHGIARWCIDVAWIRLCEEFEDVKDLTEGEIWRM